MMNAAVERCSISGASKMGKSTLAKALLFARSIYRRILVDPMDEYGASAEVSVYSMEEADDYLSGIIDQPDDSEFSVRYVPEEPEDESDETAEAASAEVGRLAHWSRSIGNNVFLVDEAHDYCHGNFDRRIRRHLKKGRHQHAYAWMISQRPSDIHPSIRAELNAHEAWYFRLAESVDLDVLRARRGKEFAERVQDLPPFRCLRVTPGLGLSESVEEWETGWTSGSTIPFARQVA